MPLGPHIPAWTELERELTELRSKLDARNVYVTDAWGNLFCAGDGVEWEGQWKQAIDLSNEAAEGARKPLQRGGSLDGPVGRKHAYVKSFATVYMVLIRFSGPFELSRARSAVAEALPRIKSLTVSLPPPDGPGSGSAEGFGVA